MLNGTNVLNDGTGTGGMELVLFMVLELLLQRMMVLLFKLMQVS